MWFSILLNGTLCTVIVYTKEKNSLIFSNSFCSLIALKLLINNINKSYCLYFQKMSQILSLPTTHSIIIAEKYPMNRGAWQLLVGYSPWSHKELDMTEWLNTHAHIHTHTYMHTYFMLNLLRGFFFSLMKGYWIFTNNKKETLRKKYPFVIASKRIK